MHEIEMVDDLMTVIDEKGHGRDGVVVDPARPWDAVETLVHWGREYDLNEINALGELRRYLKACR